MNLPTLEMINLPAMLPVLILVGWTCLLLVIDQRLPQSRSGPGF
jgi:hypothetical protein